ncbi:TIM barrel protein [Methylomonas paludis]|uniref:TIM barrel protein n=1 Tax=Methylomonas paludis TaxID=1173101 RepID=A0A975MNW1_9GAMM|nr:TIM barrel protein [Methylomonas paludis]QWF71323.1 TIM barrel protein [Methylomonas paludis]
MLRFSANLSLLFSEYPWPQRFQVASRQGFKAVEIQFPYQLPAQQLQALLQENALQLILFNVAADTLLEGGEGLAAVPEKQLQFKAAVNQAIAYAELLKPQMINVLPGRCLQSERYDEYLDTFKNNLRYAADAFAELGIRTVFEAINCYDMPGFIIDSSSQMLDILTELNHPTLAMQYDIYHMQRMGEDSRIFLQQQITSIGHIQFADHPGRGQPGSGAIDFNSLFAIIAASPYQGWVGAEYRPTGSSAASLDWFKQTYC